MSKGKIGLLFVIFAIGIIAFFPLRASLSAPDRDEMHTIIREYLLQNPEVIKEAIEVLQKREIQAMADKQIESIKENKDTLFSSSSPSNDVSDPKVTIVEFFDYQCRYCKTLNPAMTEVMTKNNDIQVIYKELPLLGGGSTMAAQAALAAHQQNKYSEFHTALMETQVKLTEEVIFEKAEKVGLDLEKLKADMLKPEIKAELEKNRELAQKLGLRGTPAIIIVPNPMTDAAKPTYLPGAVSADKLQEIIDDTKSKM